MFGKNSMKRDKKAQITNGENDIIDLSEIKNIKRVYYEQTIQ